MHIQHKYTAQQNGTDIFLFFSTVCDVEWESSIHIFRSPLTLLYVFFFYSGIAMFSKLKDEQHVCVTRVTLDEHIQGVLERICFLDISMISLRWKSWKIRMLIKQQSQFLMDTLCNRIDIYIVGWCEPNSATSHTSSTNYGRIDELHWRCTSHVYFGYLTMPTTYYIHH